jgi:threonine aldolase
VVQIRGLRIDAAKVRSNIVIFDCSETGKTAVELCELLQERGIWAQDTATYSVRLVTHVDVNREGIERALVILRDLVAGASGVKAASGRRTP